MGEGGITEGFLEEVISCCLDMWEVQAEEPIGMNKNGAKKYIK